MDQNPVAMALAFRLKEPARRIIAIFKTRGDAVDYVLGQHFSVNRLAIDGRGLQLVEKIIGRDELWFRTTARRDLTWSGGSADRRGLRSLQLDSALDHRRNAGAPRLGLRRRVGSPHTTDLVER